MSLYNLKQRAYSDYCSNIVGPPEPFAMWDLRSQTIPQFKFWTTVMKLELLMSRFVRSLREGDFPLYVKSCDELCGWFHALDHTNYARWLPVHVRDMVTLEENHPEVHAEFMNGNFVVQKSSRKFSMIALDQAHEQSNKTLQAHGGATGLYENPEALSQFILAGPDCARIIEEFEATSDQPSSSYAHHEEGHSLQIKFHKDVKSFIKVLDQMGNPFQATGPELITLDTHSVMAQSVVESLSLIEETGKVIHATYVKQRLETSAIPVTNTIKRNNILTFSNRPNTKPKRNTIVGIEKQNMALITQLFLSLQSRPAAEMVEFFRYENQKEPPSLADRGFLRFGSKSDIMQCITDSKGRAADVKQATVVLMDMAAVVHLVKPAEANTFSEYVHNQILPFLIRQMKSATTRIDLVYDCYPQDNLKNLTHQRSGR